MASPEESTPIVQLKVCLNAPHFLVLRLRRPIFHQSTLAVTAEGLEVKWLSPHAPIGTSSWLRQNRQGCIQNLAEFCATGFLAEIFRVYGASCVYKEIARFLCGTRRWDSSEGDPHGGGEKQPVSPSRLQSQQGGSVSANVGSFSNNVGRSQITVSGPTADSLRSLQLPRAG